MNQSKISIIVPTLNSEKYLPTFFKYLNKQNFPKDRVEILVVDGGSTDNTLSLAKNAGAVIIKNSKILADPGVNLGMKKATGEIVIILAVDNYLTDKEFLSIIFNTFKNEDVMAAFPMHGSFKNSNLFTKYINTFTDPVSHFIYGHAANARTFNKIYDTKISNEIYIVFDFNSKKIMPLLALAQGFSLRSNFVRSQEDEFDDVAPVLSLIENNKNIAYLYSTSIVHDTIRNARHFMHKQEWATLNILNRTNYGLSHRENTLTRLQKIKIAIWPVYVVLIIPPIINALRGFIVDNEPMWLFHPIMCYLSAIASAKAILKHVFSKNTSVNRSN